MTEKKLIEAEQKGLDKAAIKKAIGKLGNTKWMITGDVDLSEDLGNGIWCPISWVKKARKDAVQNLSFIQDEGVQETLELDEKDVRSEGVVASDVHHIDAVQNLTSHGNVEILNENLTSISGLARNYLGCPL